VPNGLDNSRVNVNVLIVGLPVDIGGNVTTINPEAVPNVYVGPFCEEVIVKVVEFNIVLT
jgi:hypothetical protein